MCEVVVEFENLVMFYLIGKDLLVLLYLVCKVFYLVKILFLFLYVDINWKFKEMIEFCDCFVKEYGFDLIVYKNLEGLVIDINLFVYGLVKYIDIMKM